MQHKLMQVDNKKRLMSNQIYHFWLAQYVFLDNEVKYPLHLNHSELWFSVLPPPQQIMLRVIYLFLNILGLC